MNFLHCTGDYEDDKVIVFGYPVIDLDLKAGDDNGEQFEYGNCGNYCSHSLLVRSKVEHVGDA